MDISIVIPTYNEEENVNQLYEEIAEVMNKLNKKYEIIFVDDGSTDATYNVLKALSKKDNHIVIVKLRKNFGQTPAMVAGFEQASGKVVITMDADLQNDPADIPRLLEKLAKGHDVVCGWRMDRKDNILKRWPSKFSNWLNRRLTGIKTHDSGCTLRAYNKEAINSIKLYGENHRYIPALINAKGYNVTEVVTHHRKRQFGKTKYGAV